MGLVYVHAAQEELKKAILQEKNGDTLKAFQFLCSILECECSTSTVNAH